MTVCFSVPDQETVLFGDSTVTAEVTVSGTDPGVRRLVFYVDGAYDLTDYQSPYTYLLPTAAFVDGTHWLDAEVIMRDGFKSSRAHNPVIFANGITSPPPPNNSFSPTSGRPADPNAPLIVAAAGDGASGEVNAGRVVDLVAGWNPNLFLYLGDVYEKGSPSEFRNWYGPEGEAWGRFRSITNPTIGNHEYEGGVAPGYFSYWGSPPEYYSYDIGTWHFISVNSNLSLDRGSPQYRWLERDLQAHPTCTIAYMHHPRWNIGPEGPDTHLADAWPLFVNYGVEFVVAGHDHSYQRWTPLNSQGQPNPAGTVQLVAGGGGHGLQGAAAADPRVVSAYSSYPNGLGAVRFELNQSGANVSYVNLLGTLLDSATVTCHGAPEDTLPPSAPTGVSTVATSPGQVLVSWQASSDNTAIASYSVFRNGSPLGMTSGSTLQFTDTSVMPDTQYTYTVVAFDPFANQSDPSEPAAVRTPPMPNQLPFTVVADTYVNAASPTTRYGLATVLRADGSPDLRSYLRFTVNGLFGTPINRALLVVAAQSGSSAGLEVRQLADASWGEMDLTYDTAPQCGAVIASSGPFATGAKVAIDITPYVGAEGSVGICLTTAGTGQISLSSLQGAVPPQLILDLDVADLEPPTAPGNLTATALTHARVDLAWLASSDNVAVDSYSIFRDGAPIASVDGSTLLYSDMTAAPSTTYSYYVQALDSAGNPSAQSNSAVTTTPGAPLTITLSPAADSYVDSSASGSNYGSSTAMRVDGSPDLRSYVRFDVSGVSGAVTSASLRVYAGSTHSRGYEVREVADNSWNELAISYATAPPVGPLLGASGATTGGTYSEIDVTGYVTGNGSFSFALTALNSTSLSLATRESAARPELVVVQNTSGNNSPAAGDVVVTTDEDTTVGWTPVVSDPDPDSLTCLIVTGPVRGLATIAPDCSTGRYTPDPDYHGPDGFVYEVTDGSLTDTGTVTVTVGAVNDIPVANAHGVTITRDSATTVSLSGSDVDGDCLLTFAIATAPAHGSVGTVSNQHCVSGDGTADVVYTPAAGFTGSDSFTVIVLDPSGAVSIPATISITIELPQTTFTFAAVADSYVASSASGSNYGSSTAMRVDGSPDLRSYVRFDVSGVSGAVTSARLRVYAGSTHSLGYEVREVADNSWNELAISYATAPPVGPLLGASGATTGGTYSEIDVTGYVTGNGSFSFVLTALNSTSLSLATRESGMRPELIITMGP